MHGIKPGELYPESVRKFCISVHFHSPAAYRTLRNAFKRKLPHPHTIAAWYRYSNIKGNPGIQQETLDRLKRIANDVEKETKQPLICSLIVDEMYIRKQVLWCNQNQKYVGYVSYGENEEQKKEKLMPIANQAIVFLLNGINQCIEFPVCYHFIRTLNASDKAALYLEIIEKITKCGVVIKNITFDGLASNFAMCKILGAQLDIFASDFKPFVLNPVNQSKIFIMFDNCHAEKLVRNTLGNKGLIYDENNEHIEWAHFEDLLKFSEQYNISTHKLSKKHIDFKSSIMNVKIATETMSNSVADSFQYLHDKGVTKFQKVTPTIHFIRIFNNLFDIFNSRDADSANSKHIFKQPLCASNKDVIYKFLDEAEAYIKNLKIKVIKKGKTKRILVTKSRNGISFRGIIINIHVIKEIYKELIEKKKYMDALSMYTMCQDFLEIFFGKIRSFHGHNNNPDVICFQSAYQKLCAHILISPPLKSSYRILHTTNVNYSNLFKVSSLRPKLFTSIEPDSEFMKNVSKEKQEISSAIFQLEEMDKNYYLTDGFAGAPIAYVAKQIEDKIEQNFMCSDCKSVFDVNEKVPNCYMSSAADNRPCQSTYNICATADKFLRCHKWNDQSDFKIKYFLIFQEINYEKLYCATSFKGHSDHKFHLIKSIINEYTRIKGNQLSKKVTINEMQNILRKRLSKFILHSGQ